ncbi:PAS domain-containing sensor histidine kinase [Bradyrhizobium sp. AZCC 2230]|uniref:PAS domain-containing sensor histidine kinase n=1 Tax=Bradyrhizobium sp. AZCC 2230 TaxID=3117021 RepID=UPI002FEFE92A
MPWTEPFANSDELRRCIRDLVALSALPAAWRDFDERQVGDSIVAALITMLSTDFVLIILPGQSNQLTELIRSEPTLKPASLDRVRTVLREENAAFGSEHEFDVDNGSGGNLHVTTSPIGLGGDAVLVAGSSRGTFPTKTERLLLTTGANQVAIAIQQRLADADKRRFTTLVQRSTDFVGITSLSGHIQHVNPAGLQSLGLSTLGEALNLHMFDFVSREYQQAVRNEIWPLVLRTGRWKGKLDLQHFGSRTPIPFLVDWFRIDDPRTGEPMNVATVSRDLSAQKAAEVELRLLNQNLERRVEQRTIELEVAHRKLLADNFEREQADRRIQKLRYELFHMARLTAAGEMAAALTHELTQPLTAVINSVNAAKRLLAREDSASLAIVQDIADEAASQALRASEIIRGFRQFVSLDETERRIEALPSIIEEAGALALSSAAPLAARLTFEFDDQAADVFVNRVQIQQVLINLIRNAFEAMVDQERREITLATTVLGDGWLEVAVSDIGPGIHDDIAGRLFEPFVSNKHNGMGLGLSFSRSIVEAHGGKLTAGQKPGGGSIFRFTVPTGGTADAS